MKRYFVYILSNENVTVFYVGVTNKIEKRLDQHDRTSESFVSKYKLSKLVYVEEYSQSIEAIKREKQLKNWHRQWKLNLIKQTNSSFKDLSK